MTCIVDQSFRICTYFTPGYKAVGYYRAISIYVLFDFVTLLTNTNKYINLFCLVLFNCFGLDYNFLIRSVGLVHHRSVYSAVRKIQTHLVGL